MNTQLCILPVPPCPTVFAQRTCRCNLHAYALVVQRPRSSWCHVGFELASVATAAGTKDKNHTSLLCHALREVARVCPDISHLPTQLLPVTKAADLKVCAAHATCLTVFCFLMSAMALHRTCIFRSPSGVHSCSACTSATACWSEQHDVQCLCSTAVTLYLLSFQE